MSKNKKRVYLLLAAVMVIMVITEVIFAHPHYHMIWNMVPGFDIIIGFAGAWGLILLAKAAMAKLLQREENYYEAGVCGGFEDSAARCGGSSGKDGDGNA